uniref:Beta-lactamase domain-containing protein n=1 Tax=Angiostrongylus cantonensis TaxID=6313 RepID=A0A0K0DHT1_ANGCA
MSIILTASASNRSIIIVIAGIPGLSVGVSVDGRTVWREGFGFANIESGSRCTADSVGTHWSLTQQCPDNADLFQTYLPEFPKKKFDGKSVDITTRQLLSHTGGIRHYRKDSKVNEKGFEDPTNSNTEEKEFLSNVPYTTVTEALEFFKDDDLVAEPGTEFRYTTYGFTLLSAVLEKVSGMEFKKLLEDLTSRLEMNHTVLDVNERIIPHRTKNVFNYYKRNGAHVLENCPEVNNSNKWAGGGILSNVTDLLTFANSMLYSYQTDTSSFKNVFLKKEIVKQVSYKLYIVFVKKKLSSGIIGVLRYRCGLWYHTGGAVGASSVLNTQTHARNAPSGVCVVMLCNLQDSSLLNLAKEVEQIFRK